MMVVSMKVLASVSLLVFLGAAAASSQELDTSGLPAETLGQSTPVFGLLGESGRAAMVFVRSGAGAEHDPRVFVTARDGWRLIQLPDGFHNMAWVYAGRNVGTFDLWTAVQAANEGGPGLNLLFASGSPDGRSWRYRGALQKISRHAMIDMVGMNPGGKGTVVLRLDEDPAADAPRLGFYSYMTKDSGRTWSTPLYSSSRPSPPTDMLAPADRAFDAKQPLEVAAWRELLVSMQSPPR